MSNTKSRHYHWKDTAEGKSHTSVGEASFNADRRLHYLIKCKYLNSCCLCRLLVRIKLRSVYPRYAYILYAFALFVVSLSYQLLDIRAALDCKLAKYFCCPKYFSFSTAYSHYPLLHRHHCS